MRGLTAALGHGFKYKEPQLAIDNLVIGAGVVGLAIARRLVTKFPAESTYIVERHPRIGEETSSRNSEVIHAGIYYPPGSLKTKLCIRGRQLLYQHCRTANVPHKKIGKLVVALPGQEPYIEALHKHAQSLRIPVPSLFPPSSTPPTPSPEQDQLIAPTQLLSGGEARSMEPDLSPHISLALYSPETGIIDSHALMSSFERDISSSEGGEVVMGTKVVRVDASQGGWVVQTLTGGSEETDSMLVKTLINASGLSSHQILNHLLPPDQRIPIYYARGSYASYRGPGVGSVKRLIYPVPDHGKQQNGKIGGHQGLGTHLTLDMDGGVRFGPDVEWIEPPSSSNTDGNVDDPAAIDFWNRHLIARDSQLPQMHESITAYLPGISLRGLSPDYVGIRPKLAGPGVGAGFEDFVIRVDRASDFVKGGEGEGGKMVTLMGIESPGLTSSMALAEMVVDETLVK